MSIPLIPPTRPAPRGYGAAMVRLHAWRAAGVLALALLVPAAMAADAPAEGGVEQGVMALPPGTPPSPSTAPGVRIWPDPAFTHWPAIAYPDEQRNIAFALPNQHPGSPGSIGWEGQPPMPITMPSEGDSASGLLPLSLSLGVHAATATIGTRSWRLQVRLVDAAQPWPLARLVEGFPVDEQGVPVVLIDRRRHAEEERRWSVLRASMPRPTGRPLLVGDPMTALGASPWDGQDAERREALDERYPAHAVLVALAQLGQPRTIVWCPGNQVLFGAGWTPEEERVLSALRTRLETLRMQPRLVLLAPPIPLDEPLQDLARQRRELLITSATAQGWTVLDAERIAGPAETANRVQDGLYTRYPTGEAEARLAAALRAELAR